MKDRIGFIGLGLMGTGMATNLVTKGWPVIVMAHRNRSGVEALLGLGSRKPGTPKAVAEASDVVVLCVTGSPQVAALIEGTGGLAATGTPLLIIDLFRTRVDLFHANAAGRVGTGEENGYVFCSPTRPAVISTRAGSATAFLLAPESQAPGW